MIGAMTITDGAPDELGATEFDADTAVTAAGENRWTATVSDRWLALSGTANGGYLLGLTLDALGRVSTLPDPLVVSAHFLRAGVPGPAVIETELVRAGRRMATVEANLSQNGKNVVRVVAGYTDFDTAEGRTDMRSAAPVLPPPQECVDIVEALGFDENSVAGRVEYRAPRAPGWAEGTPSGEPYAEFWMRFRDGREPDLRALAMLVDAAAPVVLELGARGSLTAELTVHLRSRPAPGWLACRVRTANVMTGFHEEDFEIWDAEGTLVAQSRQLALLA